MIKMDEEINYNQSKLFDVFITQNFYSFNRKEPQLLKKFMWRINKIKYKFTITRYFKTFKIA